MTTLGLTPVMERIAEVAAHVRARSNEIEEARGLPQDLLDELTAAHAFTLFLPKVYGGPQLDPVTAMEAVEAISAADGSAGWLSMVASALVLNVGWLPERFVREMPGDEGRIHIAGSSRPMGTAEAVDGGYRIRGQWDFQSGIAHANWAVLSCVLTADGKPLLDADGAPVQRSMFVPASKGRIIDTWHVVGMRGTGSYDFEVQDAFVPQERTFVKQEPPVVESALYHRRFFSVWSHSVNAGNTLGIARGALDTFRQLASEEASTHSTAVLRDRLEVQAKMGQAEAKLRGARAYAVHALQRAWETSQDDAIDPTEVIADAHLAITHAAYEAAAAVDIVFHASGTNAAYVSSGLERYFRDIHISVQHGASLPRNYERAGRVALGLSADARGW